MTVHFSDLPKGITSFGAAVSDGQLYVYGGHHGRAHEYYVASQSDSFRRLNLAQPAAWEDLPDGPRLQGLAMVAHAGNLYRIGGFSARNEQGEENDLWSVADFARFNSEGGQWEQMPALPAPRSSHDAAVLGDHLYVVGGWALTGADSSVWHDTALVADLSQDPIQWRELPQPPFQRRALTTAAFDGKLYVIGGMNEEGGPTRDVSIFDPTTQTWSNGPALDGPDYEGFGASAFATGGRLYVSTVHGNLQQLSPMGDTWKIVQTLPTSRFFHQMVPLSDDQLLIIGGASMETGRFLELDLVTVVP